MPKTDPTISQDVPVDSGMDAETVAFAEWLWTNLPTGPRKWTGLPTHEKALVCHTVTRFEAHLRTPATDTEAMGECICPKCGIRHGLSNTDGGF